MRTIKLLVVILAIMATLVGATSSGQTPRSPVLLPDSLPMLGNVQAALDYEATLVDTPWAALFARTSPTNQWVQYAIGGAQIPPPASFTNYAQLCAWTKDNASAYLDAAAQHGDLTNTLNWVGRNNGLTNAFTAYELALRIGGDWGFGTALFETFVAFTPIQGANGHWYAPPSVTNAITTNAFLAVTNGLVFPNAGGWFYFKLPGLGNASARAMRGGTASIVDTFVSGEPSGAFALSNQGIAADRLVLTLDFGSAGVVKFDERGQQIAGREPIWLTDFDRNPYTGTLVDEFALYFEPKASVVVERTTDFATWTPVQVLNDAVYGPGQAYYEANYDGYGLPAAQAAALKAAKQATGNPSRSFYRARYQ